MDTVRHDEPTLPAAPWRDQPGLKRLADALGARDGDARYVGGAVRDTLLGLDVADIDIATRHAPAEVIARLEGGGIRAVPTGIDHGTVTAVSSGTVVEVTTLRRDVSTDGRRATVAFTDDWREDAARRDFTINALYADLLTGQVYDWFGGLDDLKARRVRFIGDPYQRIAEDHLRILRFFRFHARFGETIDRDGLTACTERANDLMALSRERIAAELLKLLVAPKAVETIALMIECGIFRPVLPEITDAAALTRLAAHEAAEGVAPDAIRRLAALIAPADAEGVGARLKLSNNDRKRLQAAHDGPGNEGPRALAYRVGPAIATDRLLLVGESVAELRGWAPPRLPIGGGEIVARGIAKGPEVARILRAVESEWIARGFPDAAETGAIADQLLRSESNR
ncbi:MULTISPECIES: CCA tRNA nucleotidyltransferase [unclassified Sphingomonas]|uniref:CCA tRNA nucleotidyltransferase n=1 Tax=unclassified Sphingomonas TaxID=196159 RepID=UPI00092CC6F5|nr:MULTISPECIES: CCA tRNA nucleotidyltransferase [unclassified Sphingomonas]OJU16473.1 MAG: polynucleotide adenylyltransferase [Sphingomonas sp. 66-10]